MQAHEDFSVEIHALAHVFFAHHRKRSGQGVKAEAAHAVFDVGGAGVDHIPKIGDFAPVKARFGRIAAVLRPAAHHRFGLRSGGFDKFGGVGQMVLRIGIHLQNMRIAACFGIVQAAFHRRAFAAVFRAIEHFDAV